MSTVYDIGLIAKIGIRTPEFVAKTEFLCFMKLKKKLTFL